MKYTSIETVIYTKRDLIIKSTVTNSFKNYKAGKKNVKGENIRLSYKPITGIIIGSRKSLMDNILFPLEDMYDFIDILGDMYKAISLDDMFVLDKKDKLVLNTKLSGRCDSTLLSHGKSLTMRVGITEIDGREYEGLLIIINKSSVFELTHKEVKKLYRLLNSIDIATFTLVSSILGYTMDDMKTTDSDTLDNIERNDYTKTNNNNRDILEKKNNKRKQMW